MYGELFFSLIESLMTYSATSILNPVVAKTWSWEVRQNVKKDFFSYFLRTYNQYKAAVRALPDDA
jgi:hypothetical protein